MSVDVEKLLQVAFSKMGDWSPASSMGSLVRWTFEVAAPETERAIAKYGDGPGLFLLLRPTDILLGMRAEVVRSHVVELARRYHANEDMRLGTAAEVLCGFLGASLRAPLNGSTTRVVELMFAQVLGAKVARLVGVYESSERGSWPTELAEIEADARRKLRQEWRRRGHNPQHGDDACGPSDEAQDATAGTAGSGEAGQDSAAYGDGGSTALRVADPGARRRSRNPKRQ